MNLRPPAVRVAALLTALAASLPAAGAPEQPSTPYAGQQLRPLKALSEADVAALLAGQGMGYAKAAELNGYPGPMHVLELQGPLALRTDQVAASDALMRAHKSRARTLGAALVDAERALEALFAGRQASAASIDAATREIGLLQARLRAEHLATHVAQTALLDAPQIARYQVLRGYAGTAPGAAASPHGHHPGHHATPQPEQRP